MIVDFHTHVFPQEFREARDRLFPGEPAFKSLYVRKTARLAGVEQLLKEMDEAGVERSVIFGFPWEQEAHYRSHNDYIMASCAKYPDRLIGFCAFSPRAPGGPGEAERCLKSGLAGVGELALYDPGPTSLETDTLEAVTALCAQYHAPLLLHTNEPVGHEYPGKTRTNLRQIYGFLKAHPANRIVLAHWGGGLFFFALMKKEVGEVLQKVWLDTAASPYLYRPEIYRIAGTLMGFEKILFGSDYPLLEPARYFEEMASAGLTGEEMEKIKGRNAAELLGLIG